MCDQNSLIYSDPSFWKFTRWKILQNALSNGSILIQNKKKKNIHSTNILNAYFFHDYDNEDKYKCKRTYVRMFMDICINIFRNNGKHLNKKI